MAPDFSRTFLIAFTLRKGLVEQARIRDRSFATFHLADMIGRHTELACELIDTHPERETARPDLLRRHGLDRGEFYASAFPRGRCGTIRDAALDPPWLHPATSIDRARAALALCVARAGTRNAPRKRSARAMRLIKGHRPRLQMMRGLETKRRSQPAAQKAHLTPLRDEWTENNQPR